MDLRKIIGHRPLVMCAAGVLIVNEKNEVLLQQRTDNNMWGIPGGALELGELLEETAKREVLEETGLIVSNLDPFGTYSGEKMHHIYPNGDEVYIVSSVYITRDYDGELKLDKDESKELRFFNIDDMPKLINPPDGPIIEDFVKMFKKDLT
jgi:8-oxo-dGTP pyrophosphatase MutT (NUDIX family)